MAMSDPCSQTGCVSELLCCDDTGPSMNVSAVKAATLIPMGHSQDWIPTLNWIGPWPAEFTILERR